MDGVTGAAATAPAALTPVSAEERIEAIDVIRGFALLGILSMNILSFGLPEIARLNPMAAGGFEGLSFVAWVVCYLVFDEKMFTLFAMLFGAGMVLLARRSEAAGRSPAGLFYRRAFWLLVIGLLHGYLLWDGDILYAYAVTGMVAYLFRRRSPATLVLLGVLYLIAAAGLILGILMLSAPAGDKAADPYVPSVLKQTADVEAVRSGSYLDLLRRRAPKTFEYETRSFLLGVFPLTLGRMLLGMALMKWGVFSGARSTRFYWRLLLAGYGLGLPLVGLGAYLQIHHRFDSRVLFRGGQEPNSFGSVFVALGHVAALVLICKAGLVRRLRAGLAAVGRMALTSYLMQTVLCTTLFYGYGFGLYGRLDRIGLLGVMAAIWAVQLIYRPLWLAHFRYGPAEWLWRSLTYLRWKPILLASPGRALSEVQQ
jgi:uncharacterized protein